VCLAKFLTQRRKDKNVPQKENLTFFLASSLCNLCALRETTQLSTTVFAASRACLALSIACPASGGM
jgi:hypothetical protein